MEALVKHLSLGSDATETEIHDALEDQKKPLKDQLDEAKTAGEAKQAAEIKTINERLAALEKEQEKTTAELKVKDERIAELQVEIQGHEKTANEAKDSLTAMKEQHQKEIKVLAGKVSAAAAGRPVEQDENGGDAHNADTNPPKDSQIKVAPIASDDLKNMLKKQRSN